MSYADQHKSWPMISILSAGFAALAFWASQSDLDQLVRATGQVIPDARTQIIQAADGGVLFELRVQEGQAVKAGQILAVLEKERAQAGFKEIVARVASLRAILDRTNAEISQKPRPACTCNARKHWMRKWGTCKRPWPMPKKSWT